MLAEKQALIRREVEEGTGAAISLEQYRVKDAIQSGFRLWFSDLEQSHSPIVTLMPKGLKRFEARLTFGKFAADTIRQIKQANAEKIQLAKALVSSVALNSNVSVRISGNQSPNDWLIRDGSFTIAVEKSGIDGRFQDKELTGTCRELVIPILAAMAELYGYDPVEESHLPQQEVILEGAVRITQIRKRERNPRNRMLCLRIHGHFCVVCGMDPTSRYGDAAGKILEVHHLQPLSLSGEPRPYDPLTDLVPLCPNCHRAVHTRRPVPWTLNELRNKLDHG